MTSGLALAKVTVSIKKGLVMNRTIQKILIVTCSIVLQSTCGLITTLNNYDPQPNYTAHYAIDFLTTAHTDFLKGTDKQLYKNRSHWSLMPYYQRASKGFSAQGTNSFQFAYGSVVIPNTFYTPLGNLNGTLNLLAVLPYNLPNTGNVCGATYTNFIKDIPCYQRYPSSCQQPYLNQDEINNIATRIPANPPYSQSLASIRNQMLTDICGIFGSANLTPSPGKTVQGLLATQTAEGVWQSDPTQSSATAPTELTGTFNQIGCLQVDNLYKRYGVRFNADMDLIAGFGVIICTGFSSIEQQPTFTDLTLMPLTIPVAAGTTTASSTSLTGSPIIITTPSEYPLQYPFPDTTNPAGVTWTFLGSNPPVSADQWSKTLNAISNDVIGQKRYIGDLVGQRLRTCCVTGFEDFNIDLYWRTLFVSQLLQQIIPFNNETQQFYDLGKTYPTCTIMPYASIGGTIATGKRKNINELYSLSTGNNGHNAFRARGGISIDFYETVQICGEVGFTHFSSRQQIVAIPTNTYQNIMYPYKALTCYNPGNNLHIGLGTSSRHFYNTTSASFMYVFINHSNDCITLVPGLNCGDTTLTNCNQQAFLPNLLACKTGWRAHMINGTIVTDLSPAARGAFFIQVPVMGSNIYRSTTYAVSFEWGF